MGMATWGLLSRLRLSPCTLSRRSHTQIASSASSEERPTWTPAGKPSPSPDRSIFCAPPIPRETRIPNTTVVRDRRTAARVVEALLSLPHDALVAWDTETTGVNPAKESPVGKGNVICATAYAGHNVDFGTGPRLYVDCLDGETGRGMLEVFKGYFENERCKKVWHNYAYDRHILANHGIVTRGFGGDTMHMARLFDSSRQRYSLQELCYTYLDRGLVKTNMKERFGNLEKLKNGDMGKRIVIPETIDLQRSVEHGDEWIEYAAADAELTHRLCYTLKAKLEEMGINGNNSSPEMTSRFSNLYELYQDLLLPFGEVLTDIERTGFRVDVDWLKRAEVKADADRVALEDQFRLWAEKHSPDARYMNINSGLQKQQLFFAPCVNRKDKRKKMPAEKSFDLEPAEFLPEKYVNEIREQRDSMPSQGDQPTKKLKKTVVLKGLEKPFAAETAGGWPSVSASAMEKLAGSPRATPPIYGDPDDPDMCLAVDDMISSTRISTLISSFIVPLQNWPGADGRIHASLNLNTETGRLSSRRPNLQNQPALEKDRYRVRKAFVPEKGNSLIVADYGQLELRLLAHITNCQSMIDAFKAGGDFHSRTALTMFDEIAKSVERGECLLERDEKDADANALPLVKEKFSSERRKAKTLNFSIAYGKTVKGLARDWNVSTKEARDTLDLWYKERQEVLQWQYDCKSFVRENKYVETILGRRRHLPDVDNHIFSKRNHAERAAINAPLQGSAADLVMAAMVKLHKNRVLRGLGWKIILQVHDEIILEGPDESADVALPIIVKEMKTPVGAPLRVDLTVDAKCAKSWFEAK